MKFTQAAIERFKIPAGKSEHIEFDDGMPGFGLRVRQATSANTARLLFNTRSAQSTAA